MKNKQVKEGDEFVFSTGKASDLKEFLDHLTEINNEEFQKYINNNDFHKWIKNTLHHDLLAQKIKDKKNKSSLIKEIEAFLDNNIPKKIKKTIREKKKKISLHPAVQIVIGFTIGLISGLILSSL